MASTPSTVDSPTQGNETFKTNIVSIDQLKEFLQDLDKLPTKPPSIFLDASGIGQNKLTDLQIWVPSTNTLYIVNLVSLGTAALSKGDESHPSLRAILESGKISKAGFDIRDLSRLLHTQFNLSLGGMYDLQLMELASRDHGQSKKFLAGFAKCVDQDISNANASKLRWLTPSVSTNMHMSNSLGHVTRRSMRRVELFSVLWAVYRRKLAKPGSAFWLSTARAQSGQRVRDSKKKCVGQKDQHLGPMRWWDPEQLEAAEDDWNDEICMELRVGDWELNEDAEWVATRKPTRILASDVGLRRLQETSVSQVAATHSSTQHAPGLFYESFFKTPHDNYTRHIMSSPVPIPVLTISLSRHLNGRDINAGLEQQWSEPKVPAPTASRFSNIGFNLVATGSNLEELKSVLQKQNWSGIILGWCVRGHIEFTELFESVVAVCVEHVVQRKQGDSSVKQPKLIFCRGPDDLVNATLRNFAEDA
ncbi:hypothetical protein FGRMN_9402 [Fusarium graminum]|nr:hypothetical protein FGRMN_9402 [Fusarium graminum]